MKKTLLAAVITAFLFCGSALAIDPLSETLQLAMLVKAGAKIEQISGAAPDSLVVGVWGGGPALATLERIAAKSGAAITVKAVSAGATDGINVLFIPKSVSESEARTALATTSGILTVAGDPNVATAVRCTLSFGKNKGRPVYLISKAGMARESVVFHAGFMKMAQVY